MLMYTRKLSYMWLVKKICIHLLCIIYYLINIHKLFSIRCYSTTSDKSVNKSTIPLIFSYLLIFLYSHYTYRPKPKKGSGHRLNHTLMCYKHTLVCIWLGLGVHIYRGNNIINI